MTKNGRSDGRCGRVSLRAGRSWQSWVAHAQPEGGGRE